MTTARFHCGLGCGWTDYCPEAYGTEGPIPLHHVLVHENREEATCDGPLTVGLMAKQHGRLMPVDSSVPMEQNPYADVVHHLRINGHGEFADRFEDVVEDIEAEKRRIHDHYQGVLSEAMSA